MLPVRRSGRWSVVLVALAVFALALSACGDDEGDTSEAAGGSAASEVETARVAIYTTKSMTQFPLWVAEHKGFDERNGVKLELLGTSFNTAVQGLVSGSYDFNSIPSPSIQASLAGAPLVVTAVGATSILGNVYAQPEIKSAAGLNGKSIVANGNPLTNLILQRWLKDHGADEKSVQMPAGESVQQLLAGTAPAALVTQPQEVALESRGHNRLGDLRDYPLAWSGVTTSKQVLESKPELVDGVNKTYCDAVQFVLDEQNADEVAKDLVEYFDLGIEVDEAKLKASMKDALRTFSPDCTMTTEQANQVVDTIATATETEPSGDLSDYFADSALR
jgi:ABC-type nitrate/sulfonate/bicarbonate transport system substrate-binding protein